MQACTLLRVYLLTVFLAVNNNGSDPASILTYILLSRLVRFKHCLDFQIYVPEYTQYIAAWIKNLRCLALLPFSASHPDPFPFFSLYDLIFSSFLSLLSSLVSSLQFEHTWQRLDTGIGAC